MNFGRIFLIKCLLLLFPKAKCTSTINIYKAVNETALLSFTAENMHETLWTRGNERLLQMKDKKIKYYVEKMQCRCKVLLNGTLRIERLVKEDSGIYKVSAYDKNGKLKANETTVLIVLEPVPQPILNAECINKTLYVKCTVKKTEDQMFTIELTQDKINKSQTNVTEVEFTTRHSGRYRCIVKNQVSKKTTEKEIKCPGQLDLYLISSIAGGAVFFVVFVILLIYCIRKKKADRLEDDDEERMQIHQVDREMAMRKLPQPPSNPTPQQTCVQQMPPPQPHAQQRAVPPQPKPRTQLQAQSQLRDRH
ncbi:T-cell surface antigen CD2 isoform X2 [Meleagris gallopavo]|uniref:T-cell surface antigen CD2 isoform X2 n=1 Tax=Meleagris gallopavo TaxID=9103 RepID=UPI0005499A19|nr:T-cell surface antigen CD2 isoform X2 [Meleagris gallopavo]